MHLSFISPAPEYMGNSGALIMIVWGICLCWCPYQQGTCTGLQLWLDWWWWSFGPGIWAGTSFGMSIPWYGGQDFVVDLALKMPCAAGKSAYISGGFVTCQLLGNECGHSPHWCLGTPGLGMQMIGDLNLLCIWT